MAHNPRCRVGYYGILGIPSEIAFMPSTKEPVNKDAECIFCNGKFSEDQRGEIWIKCISCSLWAHFDCTGAEK